ncbi:hypothetical protein GCM10022213_02650 [Parerythrobacter jejuensis]
MTGRLFVLTISLVAGLAAIGFGLGWWHAVPRESCYWGAEFCSDYGPFYLTFALLGAVIALGGMIVAFRKREP